LSVPQKALSSARVRLCTPKALLVNHPTDLTITGYHKNMTNGESEALSGAPLPQLPMTPQHAETAWALRPLSGPETEG